MPTHLAMGSSQCLVRFSSPIVVRAKRREGELVSGRDILQRQAAAHAGEHIAAIPRGGDVAESADRDAVGLTTRAELRHDKSSEDVFFSDNNGMKSSQTTVLVGSVYAF